MEVDETTRTIDPEDLDDLFCNEYFVQIGPWMMVAQQLVSDHRWYERYWLVLRHEDGTSWGVKYNEGKSELQENELPWRGTEEPIRLTRLYPHDVTITKYRLKPSTQSA